MGQATKCMLEDNYYGQIQALEQEVQRVRGQAQSTRLNRTHAANEKAAKDVREEFLAAEIGMYLRKPIELPATITEREVQEFEGGALTSFKQDKKKVSDESDKKMILSEVQHPRFRVYPRRTRLEWR